MTRGWLTAGPFHAPCALGPAAIPRDKREGDGADARRRPFVSPAYMRVAFAQSSVSESS
jgi:hypothetical protein